MKQLFQDPKAGTVQVVELPEPALRPGSILVRTSRSVISPGTERSVVSAARSSYIKTARTRPDLVRRVLDLVKREGLLAAYRRVQSKLAEPQALGYSSAGTVVAVGPGAGDHFRVGDRVACAGGGVASHAEVVCVPVNLAARIPDGVEFDAAAFATLGAISLHGVRQAEPRLGDRVAVVGLGILGLLAVQLLRANGVRVAAYDLNGDLVERALALGAETGLAGGTDDQVQSALAWTEGLGVDAVLVTAASSSDAPMVAAAGMARERAKVVAVGLVPFGLPREIAYVKELELRISRSYGPGRYDEAFEQKGVDYPPGYVRWTETRNLDAFLALLGEGRVSLDALITHRYPLDEAPSAYDLLMERKAPMPIGMLIEYPEPPAAEAAPPAVHEAVPPAAHEAAPAPTGPVSGDVGLAFFGAGNFARATLLPALAKVDGVSLRRVVTAHGLSAWDASKKFGFKEVGTDPEAALADPLVHAVCITTRHDLHVEQVCRALEAGKHVFVEKPLALTHDELDRIETVARRSEHMLMVGFNRRFSPSAVAVREALAGRGPILMTYRVNAGALPAGHWLNDPEIGGGRMIGEGCHFVDLLSFLAGDPGISAIDARCAGRPRGSAESFAVQIEFADGSVGQLLYTAAGDSSLGKERVEAHAGGASVVIDDYKSALLRRGGSAKKLPAGSKGHAEEMRAFVSAVRAGGPAPIPLPVLLEVSRATLDVHRVLAGSRLNESASPDAP
jgi:predicted dehydrogenase